MKYVLGGLAIIAAYGVVLFVWTVLVLLRRMAEDE